MSSPPSGTARAPYPRPASCDPTSVVMDVKMPQTDGVTAAERSARTIWPPSSCSPPSPRPSSSSAPGTPVRWRTSSSPSPRRTSCPRSRSPISRYQQITQLESEIADLGERFETRKRVDRAKGLLQTNMGLTEPEAFRWIQKTSMDRRLTMREVADAVVDQLGGSSKD